MEILKYTLEYLQKTVPNFKQRGDKFTCPDCQHPSLTCTFTSDRHLFMDCGNPECQFNENLVMFLERKLNLSPEAVEQHIIDTLSLPLILEGEKNRILTIYKGLGFDLVPITRDKKIPVEKDWTHKVHKDKDEWLSWLDRNLNLGVKTGQCSNITVIDVDTKEIPKLLQELLIPTLTQTTTKGWHFFYKYCPDLPKTRIEELKVDVQNDGGQCVIYPSIVDGVRREIDNKVIAPFPPALKEYLLGKSKTNGNGFKVSLPTDLDLNSIPDGARHHILMKLGGLFRNHLNMQQTALVLDVLNKWACKPSLDRKEFDAIVRSLANYDNFDEKDLAKTVYKYLSIVEEATARDVKEALGFPKEKIDKILSYLCKEELIIKKQRLFHLLKKAEWKETWIEEQKEIAFEIPYFKEFGRIRNGDMLCCGGKSGSGKSHVALNIIKCLVAQGVKPYYISLESGNRFSLIAADLGLKEGDFNWCVHFSPEHIELEPNAVTIVDWLLPKDYASTDKTYEHFAHQLSKQGGVLIVFSQLKSKTKEFFAEDMLTFFPAMVLKFLYNTDEKGCDDRTTSYFEPIKIREPHPGQYQHQLICKYDPVTKILGVQG